MAKHNFGIRASGMTLLILFATLAIADETSKTPVSFENDSTAIANGPIGSIVSDLSRDKSDHASIKAKIVCTRRLMQAGGDKHCMTVLRGFVAVPHKKCCDAMADLDQEAPECWVYLISGPHWDKHLFLLNELCVARSSI